MNKKLINWWIGSGVSYTSEYQAVLDRATALGYTLPGTSTKTAQNQLIVDLKAAGVWSLLDVFYVMMANDSNLGNFSLINWVTPASYALTATNSPTYAAGGYTGNGSNSYLPSSFNPSTNGVNVALDNSSFFVYCNTTNAETLKAIMGGTAASLNYRLILVPDTGGGSTYTRCNNSADDTTVNAGAGITTSIGLWHLKRTASTGYTIYQSAVSKAVITRTSTSLPTSLEFCAYRSNGTPAGFSTNQISMGGAGSGAISESSLNTAWNTYKTAIGL